MCHVFMVRHGYKILCVISVMFVLFRLFDDVLGGPHLGSSDVPKVQGEILFSLCSLSCFVTVALRR